MRDLRQYCWVYCGLSFGMDMMRSRYVLEGIWSGYHAAQKQPCHRTVTRTPNLYKDIHSIIFTDNTYMTISLRECKPRERVTEIHGYDSLFNKIIGRALKGHVRVEEL